jgi:thiol-disulfide isomerase/thioredoxin
MLFGQTAPMIQAILEMRDNEHETKGVLMFGKVIYLYLMSLIFIGCACCTPSLSESTDTHDNSEYSFATWETCSQNIGDHPCNFTLKDQNDNDVSLYDFYGDTIVLDFSAMWCGPCRAAASEVQEVKDSYESEGLTYLTALIENSSGKDPSVGDCKDWADTYGISEPVLAGDRSLLDSTAVNGWPLESWPTFYFITNEMIINTKLKGYSSSYIDMLIQDTMGS